MAFKQTLEILVTERLASPLFGRKHFAIDRDFGSGATCPALDRRGHLAPARLDSDGLPTSRYTTATRGSYDEPTSRTSRSSSTITPPPPNIFHRRTAISPFPSHPAKSATTNRPFNLSFSSIVSNSILTLPIALIHGKRSAYSMKLLEHIRQWVTVLYYSVHVLAIILSVIVSLLPSALTSWLHQAGSDVSEVTIQRLSLAICLALVGVLLLYTRRSLSSLFPPALTTVRIKPGVLRIIYDALLGLIIIGPPFFALHMALVDHAHSRIIECIVVAYSYGFWFLYRLRRRKRNALLAHFHTAVVQTVDLSNRIRTAAPSSDKEFWSLLKEFLTQIRHIIHVAHADPGDDPDLSIWLYEPDLNHQTLRVRHLVCGRGVSDESIGSIKQMDRSPFFVMSPKDPQRITYGSTSSHAFIGRWKSMKGDFSPVRKDESKHCEAFNPTHYPLISNPDQLRHFLCLSYVRADIHSGNNAFPPRLGTRFLFPLFIFHSRPNYFTDHDKCLLEIAASALSHFFSLHGQFLHKTTHLLPLERRIIASMLQQVHETTRLTAIEGGTSEWMSRFAGRVATRTTLLDETREILRRARQFHVQQWPITRLDVMTVHGTEITHSGSHLGERADTYLGSAEEKGQHVLAAAIDITWAAAAIASTPRDSARIFVHLEWSTLASPEGIHYLEWLADTAEEKPVIVLRRLAEEHRKLTGPAAERLRRLEFETCVDHVKGETDLEFARQVGARWIKLDIEMVRSVPSDPAKQAIVSSLISRARYLGLLALVPGVREDVIAVAKACGLDAEDVFIESIQAA